MKWLFFALMLLIFFNLFRGFYFLMKEGGQNSNKVLHSLAIRVGLTIVFFVGLYVADYYELIEGHGLRQGLEHKQEALNETDGRRRLEEPAQSARPQGVQE